MFSGFVGVGMPERLVDALVARGAYNLTPTGVGTVVF